VFGLFILILIKTKFYLKNTKMSKELTTEQRGGIIFCRQRGDSYQTIATTIGCGKSTVRDTLI
jgi:hypothetical protein